MSGEESNDEFEGNQKLLDDDFSEDDNYDREDDEQEPESDYDIGGYHPVNLGDVFDSRYYTLRKLGWGHFATVWLSFDTQSQQFAAIKIPKSRQDFIEASRDELDILQVIRNGDERHLGAKNVVQVLNEFEFFGVSKSLHLCMVFEVLGDNLLTLLRRFTMLNLNLVRVISRQLLQGLSYLHDECQIIHTDIKPENVVLSLTASQLNNMAIEAFNARNWKRQPKNMVSTAPEEYRRKYTSGIPVKARKRIRRKTRKHRERLEAYLSGLDEHKEHNGNSGAANGNNEGTLDAAAYNHISCFYEELQSGNRNALNSVQVKIVDFGNACYVNHHYTEEIQTREYRSPEAILGSAYCTSADIWSAACLIFELVSGDYLFYPEANEDLDYDIDDDHVAKMIEVCGPIPNPLFRDGRRFYDIFDQRGRLQKIKSLTPTSITELLMEIASLPGIEARHMSEFLMPMLAYDIHERASASECLKSNWLELHELRGTRPRRPPPLSSSST
uniref:non-specific serine/threonine protein kinase n=1 Tax=Panagrellus redivivus TaxID=6233 RepID=A0A7E4ZZM0_PANRE